MQSSLDDGSNQETKGIEDNFPSVLRKLLKVKEKLKSWANFMSVLQCQNILNSYLANVKSYYKLFFTFFKSSEH